MSLQGVKFACSHSSHCCSPLSKRVESTDSLRGRIRELETECKKLSMDMKLKEEQIRDLEGKCQVRNNNTFSVFSPIPSDCGR